MTTMWFVATGLTLVFMAYVLGMLMASRRRQPAPGDTPRGLFTVFVVPCLNEELVVGTALDRLLSLPGRDYAVLVVDDGSSDGTAAVVRARRSDRVWLLERRPPDARRGKGAALNHAVRHLAESGLLGDRTPRDVVVAVVDADGRLEPGALAQVGPYFADPRVGGVQVGVRMYNAGQGLLARLQDFEFATFTDIFQRGRRRLGSVGMGGNGQFNRLSALQSLGPEPWSDCLTEDLDVGIRLLAAGWTNTFCPTTFVSQQAVTRLPKLVRQRGRWFQGHLQCWRRLGTVVTAPLPTRTTLDLVHILLSPVLVLLMSVSMVLVIAATVAMAVMAPGRLEAAVTASYGLPLVVAYLLSFGLAWPYAYAYWSQSPQVGLVRAVWWGHLFTFYGYLWFISGWLAVTRVALRRGGWQKTERMAEATPTVEATPTAEATRPPAPSRPAVTSGPAPAPALAGEAGPRA